MDNRYSILINSCDAYSDVWNPFFRILESTWPQARNVNIFLNTETKHYTDSFFDVKVINCEQDPQKTPWGMRLLNALDRINSDYILFMLEDFFFERPVPNEEIERAISYMNKYPDVGVLGLTCQMECHDPEWCARNEDSRMPGFVLRKQRVGFKFNAGPSIWRKAVLRKLTFNNDTPWGWEFFGNQRTWYSNDKIYGRKYNAPTIFDYDIIHGGAIHRGKWTELSVKRCIEKYKLDIDLSKRGIEEEKDFNPLGAAPKPFYKRIGSILKNRCNSMLSILYGVFVK